jgi:hypothetical protein
MVKNDVLYPQQLAQLEKAKGELRALVMLNYDSSAIGGGEKYGELKPLVENFIKELENHF